MRRGLGTKRTHSRIAGARTRRSLAFALCATAGLLGLAALPALAEASSVSVEVLSCGGPCSIRIPVYQGGSGESNDVDMSFDPDPDSDPFTNNPTYTFTDHSAILSAGTSCTSVNNHTATCDGSTNATSQPYIYVHGGDQNDVLDASGLPVDHYAFMWGDDGDDRLSGGPGPDQFSGGDDQGSDTGIDTVDYSDRQLPVVADPEPYGAPDDGTDANGDGVSEEQDQVFPDVENITGGAGNDQLTGDAAPNRLEGGPGNDRLEGGTNAGNPDQLLGGDGKDTLDGGPDGDVLSGNAGIDRVTYADRTTKVMADIDGSADDGNPLASGGAGEQDNVTGSVEWLIGGSGPDTLTGNGSANRLTGGLGADRLFGLGGNDKLFAKDGVRDPKIACGSGAHDSATFDAGIDPSPSGC